MTAFSVLYFDIGNTNCKVALACGQAPLISYTLPTNDRQTADQLGLTLLAILQHNQLTPESIKACVAASVVPGTSKLIAEACQRFLKKTLLFVPEDLPIPLYNKYTHPHEVGADRLVGAFAARSLFPKAPTLICVDFGTATTFDCIDGDTYLGGLICPGIQSSMNALTQNTAKLPKVSLDITASQPEPGISTATSISHGFVFGFLAMTEGLCKRLAETMPHPPLIVGTGGLASALAPLTSCFDHVQPDLLLEGLRILHNQQYNQQANT